MNVLIVDDTKNIRMLLTKCMEMEGHHVTVASDGKTALELFQKEHFDIAFLDIKMPQFSGTEVLKEIREMGIYTPVIIITAYATIRNAVECTNLGAVAYLQKPFTSDKIKAVLREVTETRPENGKLGNILSLAREKMESGAYPEAEKLLKSALPEYPLSPEIHLYLSEVCLILYKDKEAEQYRKIYEVLK